MGQELDASIQTLTNYIAEFKKSTETIGNRCGHFGEAYRERLDLAIANATIAFNSVIQPKIAELEKELDAL